MKISLDKLQIIKLLQIEPPFLMIDNAFDIVPGKYASSLIKLNTSDWFFDCHLKNYEAMPGTLQIEAMLQTLVLSIYTLSENKNKIAFVVDIKTQLLKKVSPNDEMLIKTEILSNKRGIYKCQGSGFVSKNLVCKGEFILGIPSLTPNSNSIQNGN